MKRKSIVRTLTAFILAGAVIACGTSCKSDKAEEETTVETSEERIEETVIETTASETAVETTETEAAVSPDDDRYRAFFETQYSNLDDSLFLSVNGINTLYAYTDLNADGSNELLIGDNAGVYAVVTEVGGTYNVTEVCGWRVQYGAEPGEYIGNGCFLSSIYNGNNYGGEFSVDVLWKYDSSINNLGILARLSGSWDPTNFTDNFSKWELYTVIDENGELASDAYSFTPDIANYTYSLLDYGDNYTFADGELVPNEMMAEFNSYADARRAGDPMSALVWLPVSEFA